MTLAIDQTLRAECGLPDFDLTKARALTNLRTIREAAIVEFRENGYAAGSVDEIARRSGVSKPTIYSYVETKQRLFLDAVGDALIAAYRGIPAVAAWHDAASARKALQQFLLSWAQRILTATTIGLRRTVIGETERFPQLARLWARTNAIYGDLPLAAALQQLQHQGFICTPNPNRALRQLIAMAIGAPQLVATFEPERFDREELRSITTDAVAVFWSHYGKDKL